MTLKDYADLETEIEDLMIEREQVKALNEELMEALEAALKEIRFDARHDPILRPLEDKIRLVLAKARSQA